VRVYAEKLQQRAQTQNEPTALTPDRAAKESAAGSDSIHAVSGAELSGIDKDQALQKYDALLKKIPIHYLHKVINERETALEEEFVSKRFNSPKNEKERKARAEEAHRAMGLNKESATYFTTETSIEVGNLTQPAILLLNFYNSRFYDPENVIALSNDPEEICWILEIVFPKIEKEYTTTVSSCLANAPKRENDFYFLINSPALNYDLLSKYFDQIAITAPNVTESAGHIEILEASTHHWIRQRSTFLWHTSSKEELEQLRKENRKHSD